MVADFPKKWLLGGIRMIDRNGLLLLIMVMLVIMVMEVVMMRMVVLVVVVIHCVWEWVL